MEEVKGVEDLFNVQKEMLELSIKAGRRMMHDFKHMLREVPNDNMFKKDFEERAEIWESIFYPDDGMKNYRSELHLTITRLEVKLSSAHQKLKNLGVDPDGDLPF